MLVKPMMRYIICRMRVPKRKMRGLSIPVIPMVIVAEVDNLVKAVVIASRVETMTNCQTFILRKPEFHRLQIEESSDSIKSGGQVGNAQSRRS